MSFLKAVAKGEMITFLLVATIGLIVELFWELFGSGGGGSQTATPMPAPPTTTVLPVRTPTKDDPICRRAVCDFQDDHEVRQCRHLT